MYNTNLKCDQTHHLYDSNLYLDIEYYQKTFSYAFSQSVHTLTLPETTTVLFFISTIDYFCLL